MIQDSRDSVVGLDDLLQRIQDVTTQLDGISHDFGQRIRLREQKREVKAIAARLSQSRRTAAEIDRELEHLKGLRREIVDGHLSVGHIGGGNGPGGGGMEPRDVFAMNEAIDKAWNRAGLEDRIERLQRELGESPEIIEPD